MTSACIFGSIARRRVDGLSDKDVLIVARSEDEITEVAREWCCRGWSIAKFTRQQMLEMAGRGSLFLQHIKQEGVVLRDDDGFLGALISRFRPRQNYKKEARESFALLHDLTSKQRSYWTDLCAADIAYGAIRNIAILSLASQGEYVFDYSDLIDHFASKSSISPKTFNALLDLRTLKHGYRNRLTTLSPDGVLDRALGGAKQLFGQSQLATNDDGIFCGYRGLRVLELHLVTKANPCDLDLLPLNDPLAAAWTLIRDPRGYPKPRLADEVWLREQYQLVESRFRKVMN